MEKSIGDKTPPCLTPTWSGNGSEIIFPHLTLQNDLEYQFCRTNMNLIGTPLSINFRRRPLRLTQSKAFEISRQHILIVELLLTKYSTIFRTENIACEQPIFFLKPNCLSDENKYLLKSNRQQFSNTFEIMGLMVIPRN